jgi:hypothetical protein
MAIAKPSHINGQPINVLHGTRGRSEPGKNVMVIA